MKRIQAAVDRHQELILAAERYIWAHPETGYKEYKTSAYMAKAFEKLGYELCYAEGITGFYTVLDTGRPGPEILVMGELDSIICPAHPESDPETGAVHSCGHNAQCAALLGVAAALKEPGISDTLCGRIKLCAVPAEELLEIEYRQELKKQGKISYMGGKVEYLYRGYFDSCDLALMVHTSSAFGCKSGSVGCLAKEILYKGTAAHAGGAPWNGKNALYAANCGLNAINAIRETFKESDIIRVHPIITNGGSMVNAIPERVKLESYVRGATFDAIRSANRRVNQALCGAALSLGTNLEIIDTPGYAPLNCDPNLIAVYGEAMAAVLPEEEPNIQMIFGSGSTDMGDISTIMPAIHPYAGGAVGISHGSNYYIEDPIAACVGSAKLQLAMLYFLLGDGAARAKKIMAEFKPLFASKEAYFEYVDGLAGAGDRLDYSDENEVKIRLD